MLWRCNRSVVVAVTCFRISVYVWTHDASSNDNFDGWRISHLYTKQINYFRKISSKFQTRKTISLLIFEIPNGWVKHQTCLNNLYNYYSPLQWTDCTENQVWEKTIPVSWKSIPQFIFCVLEIFLHFLINLMLQKQWIKSTILFNLQTLHKTSVLYAYRFEWMYETHDETSIWSTEFCVFFFRVDIISTHRTSFSAFWMRRRTYLAQYQWKRQRYGYETICRHFLTHSPVLHECVCASFVQWHFRKF